jgi:hypothetical protein
MKLESNRDKGRDELVFQVKHQIDSAAVLRILCRYADDYGDYLPFVDERTGEVTEGAQLRKKQLEDVIRRAVQDHGEDAYSTVGDDWSVQHSPAQAAEIASWAAKQVRKGFGFDDDLLDNFVEMYRVETRPAPGPPTPDPAGTDGNPAGGNIMNLAGQAIAEQEDRA